MSRLAHALRRAGMPASDPEDTGAQSSCALEQFPSADVTASSEGETGPTRSVAGAAVPTQAVSPDASAGQFDAERPVDARPIGPQTQRVRGTLAIGSAESAEKLVVHAALPHEAGEQYRRIAASLHHRQCERGLRVLMVTSAVAGEGKSLTSLNLALTLSESYGRRVLLIDADLRRPMLFKLLGMSEPTSGLSTVLRAPHDQQLATVSVSDRLDIVPPGSADPDPMSGLTSERMQRILADAASRYDWVIVDTPPAAVLPDATLLRTMVDGAILVIGAGRTPLVLVQQAVEAIGRDRILGVVLNQVESANMPLEYGHKYRPYGGVAKKGA